ncbi:MAG: peptide-methionine (S)-S-oxide reductase MsrA [Candidatus Pacearchaeota archaeon]
MSEGNERAIFGAGCFWGVQMAFDKFLDKGIKKTTVGYTGGSVKNPNYEAVCSKDTGHAEAVEIIYNPEEISYEKILDIFWKIHNPTEKNRQGHDVGSQYRSTIFYTTEKQRKIAEKSNKQEQKKYIKAIVTEIRKSMKFWPAENYHQKYYKTHAVTCHI